MHSQQKKGEAEHFDRLASEESYDECFDSTYSEIYSFLDAGTSQLDILDIGCGWGQNSLRLAKQGHRVTAIDISPKAIALGKKKSRELGLKVDFRQGDIEDMPFRDSSFDLVFAGGVFHHFPSLDKVKLEIHRVLKKDGRIFSWDPNSENLYNRMTLGALRLARVKSIHTVNEKPLSRSDLHDAFRDLFTDFRWKSMNIYSKNKNRFYLLLMRPALAMLSTMTFNKNRKGTAILMQCRKEVKE